MISGTTLDTAGTLAAARRAKAEENAAAARLLAAAVQWAGEHTVEEVEDACTWWSGSRTLGQDTGIPIAGEGCPLVSEFAVAEFATAVGMGQESGRHFVGQALELAHRLPRIWRRVMDGSLASWRARRVAEHTLPLSAEAADFVDRMLAPYAHKNGPAQTQRVVDEAIARFMPAHAQELADRTAEQRYLTIEHQQVSFAGTSRIHGELDLPDALDLEAALQTRAAGLAALGSTEPLDVRRAKALGSLARGERLLPLTAGTPDDRTGPATGPGIRQVVLYVHLSQDALSSAGPHAPVWVENGPGRLVTAGQVADWCGRPDTTSISVRPVMDLNDRITCAGYQPSGRLRLQVRLRDRTCVFPHCTRPARSCDLDHVVPYELGGTTSSDNLACLCRLHHRLKTHGGWTYRTPRPGVFLWRSPTGQRWRCDAAGTTDLAPPTVEPPRAPDASGRPPGRPPHR